MHTGQFSVCQKSSQSLPLYKNASLASQIGYLKGIRFSFLGIYFQAARISRFSFKMEKLDSTFLLHILFDPAKWGAKTIFSTTAQTSTRWSIIAVPVHPSHWHTAEAFSSWLLKMDHSLRSKDAMLSYACRYTLMMLWLTWKKVRWLPFAAMTLTWTMCYLCFLDSALTFQSPTLDYWLSLVDFGWPIYNRCRTKPLQNWLAGSANF